MIGDDEEYDEEDYSDEHDESAEEDDIILEGMRRDDIPITRLNYIQVNWGTLDREWTLDDENQLPKFLQDFDLFDGGTYIGPPLD